LVKEAIEQYRAAARLAPDGLAWTRFELVWQLTSAPEPALRDPAEALDHARKAVEITQGKHPAFQAVLALAAYRSGLYEEARAALDKTVSLGGKEDATLTFLMAMVHAQKGEHEQARAWFDKGVAWMKAQSDQGGYHRQLWEEAAELLGQPGPGG
jgi:tetratricopeptide (TPR) repeat protein